MGNCFLYNTGGININGVIEDFKVAAGNTITAGDFVSFISSAILQKNTNMDLTGASNSTHVPLAAVALDDSRVVLAYVSSISEVRLMVCTIGKDGTITTGTATSLLSPAFKSGNLLLELVAKDKVMLIYGGYSSPYYLYGIVCSISGSTITQGTATQLSTTSYSGYYSFSATKLADNKIFVAYGTGTSTQANKLYGVVCTINVNTITVGAAEQLASGSYVASDKYGDEVSCATLSTTKVALSFIVISSASATRRGQVSVCSIDGTTITAGTNVFLQNSDDSFSVRTIALSNSSFFVAYRNYGVVCTVSGTTTVNAGIPTFIFTPNDTSAFGVVGATLLFGNNILIAYYDYQTLKQLECSINGTTITVTKDATSVAAERPTFCTPLYLAGDVLYVYNVYATAAQAKLSLYAVCRVTNYSGIIAGVANDSGTEDEIIEVFVPA